MQPFKTYAEATALLCQMILCPDGIERKCCGAGMSGDLVHISFEDGAVWFADERQFMTAENQKRHQWQKEFNGLSSVDRELIAAVFGELTYRPTLKSPSKLVRVAKHRAVKAGKIETVTCGRCGGSGRYSYNQMDGDRCYGCGGTGVRYASSAATLRAVLKCEIA